MLRKNTIENYIYLFLVDPTNYEVAGGTEFKVYESYVRREPGYGAAFLDALNFALQTPQTGKLSYELVKEIHQRASTHLIGKNKFSASDNKDYRSGPAGFPLKKSRPYRYGYNYSADGLKEFANYWYANEKSSIHQLQINFEDKRNGHHLIHADDSGLRLFHVNGRGEFQEPIDISSKKATLLLEEYANNPKVAEMTLASILDTSLLPAQIKAIIVTQMDKIFASYHKEIEKAASEDEKIAVIMKHLQRIDQLHPFTDANIRTCYILMLKLFRDNNIPYAILLNPNRFDGCSVSELVAMVKSGQALFQKVMNANHADPITHELNINNEAKAEVKFPPVELADIKDKSVIDTLISNLRKGNVHTTSASLHTQSIFNNTQNGLQHQNTLLELHNKVKAALIGDVDKQENKNLLKTILENKVDVALRKCCAVNEPHAVRIILEYHGQLNFSVKAASSNGNTALDWLSKNVEMSLADKAQLRDLLLSAGEAEVKRMSLN